MNEEALKRAGIDYNKGVERYLNDAEVYEMLLLDFCGDDQLFRSEEAFGKKDNKALLEVAHEVKGTSANLDMPLLSRASAKLVSALREEAPSDERIAELYGEYTEAFRRVRDAVNKERKQS